MSEQLIGVIPAAGKGLRFRSHTARIHKSIIPLDGVPLLERNLSIMRDQLGIKKVYILSGYKENQLRNYVKSNKNRLGVEIDFIGINNVENGLADGFLQAEKELTGKGVFCVMLSDELYHKADFSDLLNMVKTDFSAVCVLKKTSHPGMIRKNYAVEIENGKITSLMEKPDVLKNNYLGCGTFLLKQDIFDYIRSTPPSERTKKVELIDAIDMIASRKGNVLPFFLDGNYVNLNSIDDYNSANYMLRAENFSKKKISLIIPAYNESISIGAVVDSFKEKVDEVIVVDNNSTDGTGKIARARGARVLSGTYKGYGDALKFGMDNAKGDILILTEADGSFFSRDLNKILEYLKDADMVLGTRTTKQMIEQAANMSVLLRIGNIVVAKIIEFLWLWKKEPRLTDVGCTYRGIWKLAYNDIRDSLNGAGPEFSPEMIVECIRHNKRVIEIPITYSGRIGGDSKFSKNLLANARTALKMLKLIALKKLSDILRLN